MAARAIFQLQGDIRDLIFRQGAGYSHFLCVGGVQNLDVRLVELFLEGFCEVPGQSVLSHSESQWPEHRRETESS